MICNNILTFLLTIWWYLGLCRLQAAKPAESSNTVSSQTYLGQESAGYGPLKWSYSGKKAPLFWRYLYDECGNNMQSPINIVTENVTTNTKLGELSFKGYKTANTSGKTWTLKNNGNSVTLKLPSESISIQNGGLPGVYRADHLHFHWGSKNTQGSEHEINGKRYPMELHIVHYAQRYKSVYEAMKHKQGLAVLGILFKIGKVDNPKITHLIKNFIHITHKGQSIQVEPYILQYLLPSNVSFFYRYEGSLTTPPCSESVVWTVFKKSVYLSLRQMLMFRNFLLFSDVNTPEEHEMVNNFRPTKPLNGRTVYQNKHIDILDTEESFIEESVEKENTQTDTFTDPRWAFIAIPFIIAIGVAIYMNHKHISRILRKKLPEGLQQHQPISKKSSINSQQKISDVVYIEDPVTLENYNSAVSPKIGRASNDLAKY